MNLFDNKKILKRYRFITILFVILGVCILLAAFRTMTINKQPWLKLAESLQKDSVISIPTRGNILSCNGEVLASSLPKYAIYMDFLAGDSAKMDSIWTKTNTPDSICSELNRLFPERSASEFKANLELGRKKGSRHWKIWPKRVDYNTLKELQKLPIFCLKSNTGGFHYETYNSRSHPFESLASRTIGDLYSAKDSAKNGLELTYDSVLRGIPGLIKRRKVMSSFIDIIDKAAIDGADIITTIDVNMQDLAEQALIEQLKRPDINGNVGVAILMECKTGDIKAIVNMTKCADGTYHEIKNNAVSDLLEPGSVFKTASVMVALDDGVCDTSYMINTGCGIREMYGRKMKDHNWYRGGYHTISLARSLEVSSNIGISAVIDKYYHNNPEKYVDGLYRIGIGTNLNLPFYGSSSPRIRHPKKDKTGKHWANWYATALAWMSIGYETQVPPISTISFYNAIANNGVMMQPRFVSKVVKDGETLLEIPPVVLKEKIAKESTIKTMQTLLTHVVSQGLGKQAGSKLFSVAGKTGTAQISQGAGGYKVGRTNYLVSFAGFFPADNPQYSCIVCIQKSGLPASGGGMAGPVFKKIAEGVMAKNITRNPVDAKDTLHSHKAIIKKRVEQNNYRNNIMPDVTGMGARDAVYALESRGIKVVISGRGTVKSQSIAYGSNIRQGMVCNITLN